MDFYNEFAEKYDDLVSLNNRIQRESNFFNDLFKKNNVKKILDCACGTGHHIIMLKKLGYEVSGSDISSAMIKKANENLKKLQISASIINSDFINLHNNFKEKFDAVICVGNSLPHVFSLELILKSLKSMYEVLNKNGILILEQRNYDKLIKNKKRFFPVTIKENEIFFYVLDYYPNKIVFNVVNIEIKKKHFKVFSTDYNPILIDQLERFLKKVDFKDITYYQDFNNNKFDKNDSDHLIIVCKKI